MVRLPFRGQALSRLAITCGGLASPLPARGAMFSVAALLDTAEALVFVDVTGPGAILQLAQLVENRQRSVDLEMRLRAEGIGMTGGAGASGRCVIEAGARPRRGGMAIAASVVGPDMIRRLAAFHDVVVAAEAGAPGGGVIECDSGPGGGDVAVTAAVVCGDVLWRLATRHTVVVTTEARALGGGVIEGDRRPRCRDMTITAAIGRGDVRWRLAACHNIVVTAETTAHGLRVIE